MADGRPDLPTPNEIMRQNADMKKVFEPFVETLGMQAKVLRAVYEALVREGFTPAQALEIVKARGYDLSGA